MKTRTNLYRNIGVHTKPLNGVSIHKNVSFGSFYNTWAEKCTTLMKESSAFQQSGFSCSYFKFRSHFHFQFSFETRTAHQEIIKTIYECKRTSNLPDLMYAQIIKYCLVYFCVAFSRVLRIMTQNESCDIRQLYVVELAVLVLFLL